MAESSKLKTGIFSGSFNPIHIGHLALANYLCEYEGLDEIWFLPNGNPPHKSLAEVTPGVMERGEMSCVSGWWSLQQKDTPISMPRTLSFICHALHTAYIRWKSYTKPIRNENFI